MPFEITFDYRFDTIGFFDDPDRRAALEASADIWENLIQDEFDDVPAGTVFTIDDPSNAGSTVSVTLDTAIDDLMIFVGAQDLGGPLGLGGYDGVDISGDIYDSRISGNFRGEVVTDFEPWVGTVTFDINADWSFEIDDYVSGKSDFISVALHEIAHVLGIGTSPIFRDLGSSGDFEGVNATAVNDGDPVPLQSGLGHVAEGFDDNTVLVDPILTSGTRSLPGRFDLALLADIGYEIDGYVTQGETPALTTDGDDIIVFGTVLSDTIDGGEGQDQIQGNDGDDMLLGGAGNDTIFGGAGNDEVSGGAGDDLLQAGSGDDTLTAGAGDDLLFGQSGTDTFVISAGGGVATVSDFDLSSETFVLDGSGFESAAAAAAAITKPFSNVSRLTFEDGTQLDVFHDSQSGTPLDASHFTISDAMLLLSDDDGLNSLTGGNSAERLEGLDGDDILDGGAGDDIIDGGTGSDTWVASGTGAVRVDLAAGTAIDGFGDTDTLISIENAQGGMGDDTLIGSNVVNHLSGGTGDDTYFIDDRRDTVVEVSGAGFDRIFATGEVTLGGAEIEQVVLEGSSGLRVNGNGYATEIIGNAGSNILIGGGGGDVLSGGEGTDYFVFLTSDADGAAQITDFGGRDKIALDDRFFGMGDGSIDVRDVSQQQVMNALQSGAAHYNGNTGELWIDEDGRNGSGESKLIAVLEGGGPLDADDFLLF